MKGELFQSLRKLKLQQIPHKGWVKSIRTELGMTMRQLARRVKIHHSRIGQIEKNELSGDVTLRTLQRIANAMESDFVYAIVPRRPIDQILEEQKKIVNKRLIDQTIRHMALEDQEVAREDIQDLISQSKRSQLWNEEN